MWMLGLAVLVTLVAALLLVSIGGKDWFVDLLLRQLERCVAFLRSEPFPRERRWRTRQRFSGGELGTVEFQFDGPPAHFEEGELARFVSVRLVRLRIVLRATHLGTGRVWVSELVVGGCCALSLLALAAVVAARSPWVS